MKTKERLALALEESGAPVAMVEQARAGGYDDYESDSATPQLDLIRDCAMYGLHTLIARVKEGEFEGTKEEGMAWFKREGKYILGVGE
jgi:hypothetical protein